MRPAVGGAAGGAVFAATGDVDIANAATGLVTTGVSLSLEKVTGANDASWGEIAEDAVTDGVVGLLTGKIPIPVKGVTTGPDNAAAVYSKGLSQMRSGAITHMSGEVIRKGAGAGIVAGFPLDAYYTGKKISAMTR